MSAIRRCTLFGRVRIERRFGAQLQSECPDDPENGVQTGVALARKRLVEPLAGQAGIGGDALQV